MLVVALRKLSDELEVASRGKYHRSDEGLNKI